MFLLVELRALAGDHPEILVEAGKIIETAFIAELFDADPVVDEQLAGMPDAYFRQELGIGFSGPGFKIPAERIRHQPCYRRYLAEVDLLVEMAEGIIIDSIDAVVLRFGEIRAETDGGEQLQVLRAGKGGQTFDQGDDPVDTLCGTDLLYQPGDGRLFLAADEDAPPGLVQ